MIEPNTPIDIGEAELAPHRESVEHTFASFSFRGSTHNLADLLRHVDPDERHVMGAVERDVYDALREGLQIFRAVAALLSDKVGLKKLLAATPSSQLAGNTELAALRGFTHNYATFAAATFIAKKLEGDVDPNEAGGEDTTDLSVLSLDSSRPEATVVKRLLAPVFAQLIANAEEGGRVFGRPDDFARFTQNVFKRYAELTVVEGERRKKLNRHIQGYRFRLMDEFVVLEGFEDVSIPTARANGAEVSFQPIKAEEIVGNRSAKRKIARYIERLALYDANAQMNPVLELGGLSWSNLFDGPPGTGKSSIFRLAMTRLKELADQVGLPFNIVTVDQSIKDEYYGKTGKLLLEKLRVTHDPRSLSLVVFDDIDLLTSKRGDAQGADNDVNNIVMQYLDGVFTVRRGNVVNCAASNEPTGVDDALRNRFNDRLLIDGPTTGEDFADMLVLMGRDMLDRKLLDIEYGYEPFATQDMPTEGGWTGEDVASYLADEFTDRRKSSILEFGSFVAELKQENPLITGRSMRAIIDAVKERCASFDVPSEWFEQRDLFLELPYEDKVEKLAELYQPITPDVLFQEARRYFDSEQRFHHTEAQGHVDRGYNNLAWNVQSEIRFLEDQVARGKESDLERLRELRRRNEGMTEEKARMLQSILDGAGKEGAGS